MNTEEIKNQKENRIDQIIHDLERLWKQKSEMRLGQLLENYVFNKGDRGDKTSVALFYQEDAETDKKIIFQTNFQHPKISCSLSEQIKEMKK